MRPFSRSVTERVECGQVVDVDELEAELLGHHAHRAVGERARDVAGGLAAAPRRAARSRGGSCRASRIRSAQLGVRAPRLLGRGDRLARAALQFAVQADDRLERLVGHALGRPDRPGARARVDADSTARARARSRGRRAGWAARGRAGRRPRRRSRSAIACSSDSFGSRLPFSMRRQLAARDADRARRAGRGSARARRGNGGCGGRGSRVPGVSAFIRLRIAKESQFLTGEMAEWMPQYWRIVEDEHRSDSQVEEDPWHLPTIVTDLRVPDRNPRRPTPSGARPARHRRRWPRLRAWVDRDRGAHPARPRSHWVDGSTRRERRAAARDGRRGQAHQAQPRVAPGQLPRPHRTRATSPASRTARSSASERRGGRRPDEQLARPARDARRRSSTLFDGSMRGRTMYVVPFSMGPLGGPLSHSACRSPTAPYVVASIGHHDPHGHRRAAAQIAGRRAVGARPSTRSAHPLAAAASARCRRGRATTTKYIVHFPDTREVWSFGSGYGGNAHPRQEVLRAAHRLGHRPRRGLARRAHAAHPASLDPAGKRLPRRRRVPVGVRQDQPRDAAPDHPRLARRDASATTSPGCAPARTAASGRSTPRPASSASRPAPASRPTSTAVETLWGNTIFTNVALRPDGDVWWEGLTDEAPAELTDWEGNPWTPDIRSPGRAPELALHRRAPRSARRSPTTGTPRRACRSTRSSSADAGPPTCRSWSEATRLDARRLHGRDHLVRAHRRRRGHRRRAAPRPVRDAPVLRLQHGRLLRATGSRSARSCGFDRAPRIFQVNWFRKGADGRFLWPGFGDNARVHRLDHPPHRGRASARSRARSAACRAPRTSTSTASTCRRPTSTSCSPSTATRGCARPTSPRSSSRTFDGRVPAAAAGRALEPALPPPAPARMTR